MTSTEPTGTDTHPDPETLADLQEGLLPPSRAAAVTDHVDQCAACARDIALLRALPAHLAAAGDTGPIPADVAARVDDAIGSEGRSAAVTITPLDSARGGPRRQNRVLQAAAAAVLVLAGTAIGVSALQAPDAADEASTTAEDSAGRDDTSGSVPVLSSGTDYTADSVAAAVPRLLAGDGRAVQFSAGASAEGAQPDDKAAPDAARLSTGAALSGCVSALTDDPDTTVVELPTPLAVDIASFGGNPATVIVLPTADQPDRVDVYVVAPDCSPLDAKVLHFARVPRP